MRNLSPYDAPQKLGTQLSFKSEGSHRQLSRLYPVKYLIPPTQDVQKYIAVSNGSSSSSSVSDATQTDYYGQCIFEDDAESDNEDADSIPLIEPAPRRAQFAEESICACCRFSLLRKSELAILDDYAKHVATQHWSVPYLEKLKVQRIKHKFEKLYTDRGHVQTWFYRLVMESRLMSVLFLSMVRREKNIVDNERFTKEAVDVRHRGPSEAQMAARKRGRRSEESRTNTSTSDGKSRPSSSQKGRSLRTVPSIVIQPSESAGKAQEEDREPVGSQDGVQVSFSLVGGKPSLHRLSRHELQEMSSGDESDEGNRGNRRRKTADHITPAPVPLPISSIPVEVPEPPSIVLFAPDLTNPAPIGDGSGNEFPNIIISTSRTGADPVVLFDPSTEAPHDLNRADSTASTSAADKGVSWAETQTRTFSNDSKVKSHPLSSSHEPVVSQESDSTEASTSTTTLVNASAKRPEPILPAHSEGPSTKSIWIIIGWFPAEVSEPIETCVIVQDPGHFLPDLKAHITGLRGWRSIFSFKSVQGFGLYKCRPQQLGHVSHHTTELENLALSRFFQAMDQSYRRADYQPAVEGHEDEEDDIAFLKRRDSKAWAEWVHKNLNASRSCPFRSQLSIKLVLRWSTTRISIASAIPLLLSFIVGFWYSAAYDDQQTAWTISSFIVTAGAFIIAILAALTSLRDGQATPYPKVVVSDDVV